MPKFFFNLNTNTDALPGILMVPRPDGFYFGRIIHAEVDHYSPPVSRRKPPCRQMHYHIVLVTGGSGSFEISNRILPAKQGTVFFTSPEQPHQFLNAGKDTARYSELTFEFVRADGHPLTLGFSDLLSAWLHRPCDPLVSHPLHPAQAGVLAGSILGLVNRGKATPRPDDLELAQLLEEIMIQVFRTAFQRETARSDAITRARDLIRVRYHQPIRLAALAREVGMSPAHFSRQFKVRFGRAPMDYLVELRLRSACGLLRTSVEPLSSIAAAVGFDDVYYFSRLFRKKLGEAPGRFRRSTQVG